MVSECPKMMENRRSLRKKAPATGGGENGRSEKNPGGGRTVRRLEGDTTANPDDGKKREERSAFEILRGRRDLR